MSIREEVRKTASKMSITSFITFRLNLLYASFGLFCSFGFLPKPLKNKPLKKQAGIVLPQSAKPFGILHRRRGVKAWWHLNLICKDVACNVLTMYGSHLLRTLVRYLVVGFDVGTKENTGKYPDDGKAIHHKTEGDEKGQRHLRVVDVGVQ